MVQYSGGKMAVETTLIDPDTIVIWEGEGDEG